MKGSKSSRREASNMDELIESLADELVREKEKRKKTKSNVPFYINKPTRFYPVIIKKGTLIGNIYESYSTKLNSYLAKDPKNIKLFGNYKYTNTTAEYYILAKLQEKAKNEETSNSSKITEEEEKNEEPKDQYLIDYYNRPTNDLTPIPAKSKKKLKNKTERREFYESERTAVAMRRYEYNKRNQRRKIESEEKQMEKIMNKIVLIQRWWKEIYSMRIIVQRIIMIQSAFRGYLFRRNFNRIYYFVHLLQIIMMKKLIMWVLIKWSTIYSAKIDKSQFNLLWMANKKRISNEILKVILIQSYWRKYKSRKKYLYLLKKKKIHVYSLIPLKEQALITKIRKVLISSPILIEKEGEINFYCDKIRKKSNDLYVIYIQRFWRKYILLKNQKIYEKPYNEVQGNYLSKQRLIREGKVYQKKIPDSSGYFYSKEVLNKNDYEKKVRFIQNYWRAIPEREEIPSIQRPLIPNLKSEVTKERKIIQKPVEIPSFNSLKSVPSEFNKINILEKPQCLEKVELIQKNVRNFQALPPCEVSKVNCDYKNSGYYLTKARIEPNTFYTIPKSNSSLITKVYRKGKCIEKKLKAKPPVKNIEEIPVHFKPKSTQNLFSKVNMINEEGKIITIQNHWRDYLKLKREKEIKSILKPVLTPGFISKNSPKTSKPSFKPKSSHCFMSKETMKDNMNNIILIQNRWKDHINSKRNTEKPISVNSTFKAKSTVIYKIRVKPVDTIETPQVVESEETPIIYCKNVSQPHSFTKSVYNPTQSIKYCATIQKKFRDSRKKEEQPLSKPNQNKSSLVTKKRKPHQPILLGVKNSPAILKKSIILNKGPETEKVNLIEKAWINYQNRKRNNITPLKLSKDLAANYYVSKNRIIKEHKILTKPITENAYISKKIISDNQHYIPVIQQYWKKYFLLKNGKPKEIISKKYKNSDSSAYYATKERKRIIIEEKPIIDVVEKPTSSFLIKTNIVDKPEQIKKVCAIQRDWRNSRNKPAAIEPIKIEKYYSENPLITTKERKVVVPLSKIPVKNSCYISKSYCPSQLSQICYIQRTWRKYFINKIKPIKKTNNLTLGNYITKSRKNNLPFDKISYIQDYWKKYFINKTKPTIKIANLPLKSYITKSRKNNLPFDEIKYIQDSWKKCLINKIKPIRKATNLSLGSYITKSRKNNFPFDEVRYIQESWRKYLKNKIKPTKKTNNLSLRSYITKSRKSNLPSDKIRFIQDSWKKYLINKMKPTRKATNLSLGSYITKMRKSNFPFDEVRCIQDSWRKLNGAPKNFENEVMFIPEKKESFVTKIRKAEPKTKVKNKECIFKKKTVSGKDDELTKVTLIQKGIRNYLKRKYIYKKNKKENDNDYISKERRVDFEKDAIKSLPQNERCCFTKENVNKKDSEDKIKYIQKHLRGRPKIVDVEVTQKPLITPLKSYVTKERKACVQVPELSVFTTIKTAPFSMKKTNIVDKPMCIENVELIQRNVRKYQSVPLSAVQLNNDHKNFGYLITKKRVEPISSITKPKLAQCQFSKTNVKDNSDKVTTVQREWKRYKSSKKADDVAASVNKDFKNKSTLITKTRFLPLEKAANHTVPLKNHSFTKLIYHPNEYINKCTMIQNRLRTPKKIEEEPILKPINGDSSVIVKKRKAYQPTLLGIKQTPMIIKKTKIVGKGNDIDSVKYIQNSWTSYLNKKRNNILPLKVQKDTATPHYISKNYVIKKKKEETMKICKSSKAFYTKRNLLSNKANEKITYIQRMFRKYILLKGIIPTRINLIPVRDSSGYYVSKVYQKVTPPIKIVGKPEKYVSLKTNIIEKPESLKKVSLIQRQWRDNKTVPDNIVPIHVPKDYNYNLSYISKSRVQISTPSLEKQNFNFSIQKKEEVPQKPPKNLSFLKILVQRIQKNGQECGYLNNDPVKNSEYDKNSLKETYYFNCLRRHLKLTDDNMISNNEEADIVDKVKSHLKTNLPEYYQKGYNKRVIPYIPEKEEESLEKKNLYSNSEIEPLAKYINYCYEKERGVKNCKTDLIKNRLLRKPLNNTNVFAITKTMDNIYQGILDTLYCQRCYCKVDELCDQNCVCHQKNEPEVFETNNDDVVEVGGQVFTFLPEQEYKSGMKLSVAKVTKDTDENESPDEYDIIQGIRSKKGKGKYINEVMDEVKETRRTQGFYNKDLHRTEFEKSMTQSQMFGDIPRQTFVGFREKMAKKLENFKDVTNLRDENLENDHFI